MMTAERLAEIEARWSKVPDITSGLTGEQVSACMVSEAARDIPELIAEVERLYADMRKLRLDIAKVNRENGDEIERLRYGCAAAYQLAGACGATVEEMDNYLALAEGESLPHEWKTIKYNRLPTLTENIN